MAFYSIPFSTGAYVYVHYTYACAELAGVLPTLFFAWNVSQTYKEPEAKQSVMIHHVKVTHPLLQYVIKYAWERLSYASFHFLEK